MGVGGISVTEHLSFMKMVEFFRIRETFSYNHSENDYFLGLNTRFLIENDDIITFLLRIFRFSQGCTLPIFRGGSIPTEIHLISSCTVRHPMRHP